MKNKKRITIIIGCTIGLIAGFYTLFMTRILATNAHTDQDNQAISEPETTVNPAVDAIYIDDEKTTLDGDTISDIQAIQQELEDTAAEQQAAKAEEEARQDAIAEAKKKTEEAAASSGSLTTDAEVEGGDDIIEGLDDDYYDDYSEDMSVEVTPEATTPKIDLDSLGDDIITDPIDFGDPSQHLNEGLDNYTPQVDMSDWDIEIY